MSMLFVAFGMILLFSSPFAVELSVCIGFFGCGCPSSSSVFLAETASFQFMNSAPSSASAADDISAFIICATFITAPLFAASSLGADMNQWSPALLLAFDSDKYDASLCIARTMSLFV